MKKVISNWSIAGMVSGFLLAIFSAVRYFIMYPDMDKAVMYVVIGVIIIGISWNYNVNIEQNIRHTAVENYLADKSLEEKEKIV